MVRSTYPYIPDPPLYPWFRYCKKRLDDGKIYYLDTVNEEKRKVTKWHSQVFVPPLVGRTCGDSIRRCEACMQREGLEW